MTQRECKAALIALDELLVAALAPAIEGTVSCRFRVLEHERGHHGRQCERDHRGKHHGYRDNHAELPEQAADDSAHEQQWNEHGDQGDGDGYDGEADLLRAHERRGDAVAALLKIAEDVFQHDDCVIHDQTDRKRQRHQRQVIQAVVQGVHDAECANQ